MWRSCVFPVRAAHALLASAQDVDGEHPEGAKAAAAAKALNASAAAASERQRHARLPVQSDFFNEDDVMDDAQAPSSEAESDDESEEAASDLEADEV